jgi:hypothetical protein
MSEPAGLIDFEKRTGETGCLISFYVSERDWRAYCQAINALEGASQFHALREHIKTVGAKTLE